MAVYLISPRVWQATHKMIRILSGLTEYGIGPSLWASLLTLMSGGQCTTAGLFKTTVPTLSPLSGRTTLV